METAIRSSNAQKDPPDVLRRLDARMLEYSQGEIGWDVFTLEYKVDAPLDTVLDPDSMIKYLKLFNHLWKMKRIENTITKGWVRTAGATKAFVRIPGRSLWIPRSLQQLTTEIRAGTGVAQNSPDYRGNDSFYTTDGSLLPLGGHRVLLEGTYGLCQREGRRFRCLD